MKIWLRDIAGNFYRFSCYIPMKSTFTIDEIVYLIEHAESLTDLARISAILQVETDRYNVKTLEAFHILLEAKRDIILNNDTLPQKE